MPTRGSGRSVNRWLSGGFVLLAVGVALPGCGGDDKPNAPTKAQFVRRACVVQVAGNRKLEAAGRAFKRGATEKQFVQEKVAPIFENSLIKPLDALTPPEGDEQQIDAIIAEARRGLEKLKANPDSIRAQPGSAQDPFRRFNELANAYGLVCPAG